MLNANYQPQNKKPPFRISVQEQKFESETRSDGCLFFDQVSNRERLVIWSLTGRGFVPLPASVHCDSPFESG